MLKFRYKWSHPLSHPFYPVLHAIPWIYERYVYYSIFLLHKTMYTLAIPWLLFIPSTFSWCTHVMAIHLIYVDIIKCWINDIGDKKYHLMLSDRWVPCCMFRACTLLDSLFFVNNNHCISTWWILVKVQYACLKPYKWIGK